MVKHKIINPKTYNPIAQILIQSINGYLDEVNSVWTHLCRLCRIYQTEDSNALSSILFFLLLLMSIQEWDPEFKLVYSRMRMIETILTEIVSSRLSSNLVQGLVRVLIKCFKLLSTFLKQVFKLNNFKSDLIR